MTPTAITAPSAAAIASLGTVVVDCADPLALAGFYSRVTGRPVDPGSEASWAQIEFPGGIGVAFQQVPDFVAPTWPGGDHPQQFHLDFYLAVLDEGERQVLALGATKDEHQPGTTFRVFRDPEGHPFCLCQA